MNNPPIFNVGDKVILSPAYGDDSVAQVVKVTKTRAYISDTWYFDRSTGCQPGSGAWRAAYIYPATDEWVAKIEALDKRRNLQSRIAKTDWTKMPVERLERVIAVIEEKVGEGER